MIVGYGSVKWFQWLTLVMDGASFCHHKQYIWGPLRIHSDMNGIIFFLFYILYIFCPSNLTFTGGGVLQRWRGTFKKAIQYFEKRNQHDMSTSKPVPWARSHTALIPNVSMKHSPGQRATMTPRGECKPTSGQKCFQTAFFRGKTLKSHFQIEAKKQACWYFNISYNQIHSYFHMAFLFLGRG